MTKSEEKRILNIIRNYLLDGVDRYVHDSEAHHKQGRCSYSLTSICMAEEHKVKGSIKELLLSLLSDIERDICTGWSPPDK